jgi:hypothetical protein
VNILLVKAGFNHHYRFAGKALKQILFHKISPKCFAIAAAASIDQQMLNQIIVGSVLTVDDQISARLETNAKIYSHHHCFPNSKPGKIIHTFVMKAKNSTVFGLFQYSL